MPCSAPQLLHFEPALHNHILLKPKWKRLIILAIQIADRNFSLGRFSQWCLLRDYSVMFQLRSPELLFWWRQIVIEDEFRIDRIATPISLDETRHGQLENAVGFISCLPQL